MAAGYYDYPAIVSASLLWAGTTCALVQMAIIVESRHDGVR